MAIFFLNGGLLFRHLNSVNSIRDKEFGNVPNHLINVYNHIRTNESIASGKFDNRRQCETNVIYREVLD